MYENKNEQNTGTKTIKKIGKVTYEFIVHFNENATETMQDQLKRIMLREMEREKYQNGGKKAVKMIRKSLTSCYRSRHIVFICEAFMKKASVCTCLDKEFADYFMA